MKGVIYMSERKSWKEIQKEYPSMWVGLTQVEWDNPATVKSAVVLYTEKDMSSDDMAILAIQGKLDAARYTTPDESLDMGALTTIC